LNECFNRYIVWIDEWNEVSWKYNENTIDGKKIVDKILIILVLIEEIKDLSIMNIQGLIGSLRFYDQRLLCCVEKLIKSMF